MNKIIFRFQGKNPIREQGVIGFLRRRYFDFVEIYQLKGFSFLVFSSQMKLTLISEVIEELKGRYNWIQFVSFEEVSIKYEEVINGRFRT